MTKCLITGALKYLSDAAEVDITDRDSYVMVCQLSFLMGRISLLTSLLCLSCKIIKAV